MIYFKLQYLLHMAWFFLYKDKWKNSSGLVKMNKKSLHWQLNSIFKTSSFGDWKRFFIKKYCTIFSGFPVYVFSSIPNTLDIIADLSFSGRSLYRSFILSPPYFLNVGIRNPHVLYS